MSMRSLLLCVLLISVYALSANAEETANFLPGGRALLEAHNCYPYNGMWQNRIDRALSAGFPIGIEMDLAWHAEGNGGAGRLILAHSEPYTDQEPTLREYFFEKVRPQVEAALASGDKKDWPLITLNINDIRGDSPAMHPAVWALTGEYEDWLCTAIKGTDAETIATIEVKPILILTGGGSREVECFYDTVPAGGRLRIFGSGEPNGKADNFRRWINYPWSAVETGGQRKAGDWTEEDANRLASLVQDAHQRGFWIRIYSLNGHGAVDLARFGLSPGYNFGSIEAVQQRWTAAFKAGVDFIATDQCEDASKWLISSGKVPEPQP